MTPGAYVRLGVAAALLTLSFILGYQLGAGKAARQTVAAQSVVIEKAQEGAKSARQARETRESIATQREDQQTRQKEALDEAAKATPDWSDAPVPDGVWDALGGK